MKFIIRNPALYRAPEGKTPPPLWIRALLILTCTGVSFAHGSNDGQKGMGLIMLILIGTVPTAYALNRTMPDSQMAEFSASASAALSQVEAVAPGAAIPVEAARATLSNFVAVRKVDEATLPALGAVIENISGVVTQYGSFKAVPAESAGNTRNDMYLASEAIRFVLKDKGNGLAKDQAAKLSAFKSSLDKATRFIPFWVKVSVALALGLGTMVGWKRIVVTVGEKIGKTHLTYGQGAAAEIVAAGTIGAADLLGLPVSTTHVLSSGVAGTMAANGSGLQWATVRNLLLAWVLTLPAAIMLSATLYFVFASLV
jgi:PiT family inorganic phosphate transporter